MKGVYTAFFRLQEEKNIAVGSLGKIRFDPGIYAYTGSGRSNVLKRLERHFSSSKNVYWHIDYFSVEAEPLDFFILPESSEYECILADIVGTIGDPVKDFGSSDCECESHFFRL